MSKDGKYVICTSDPEGQGVEVTHSVSRALCLLGTRPGCGTCANSQFDLLFQIRVADQVVACPRWRDKEDQENKRDPLDYVAVQRDTCIRFKPFDFCEACPNSKPGALPQTAPKWFEEQERARRIELELDQEERD